MLDCTNLKGKILISVPSTHDTQLSRLVVLVYQYDQNGAAGLILNHPLSPLCIYQLLDKLKIDYDQQPLDVRVHYGGSQCLSRGIVLHASDFILNTTVRINDQFSITNSMGMLRSIAHGVGPKEALIVLGRMEWSVGQLESEIRANLWLVGEPEHDLVFKTNSGHIWDNAISTLGMNPVTIPHQIRSLFGHA